MKRVAVIGAGLQAKRRLPAIADDSNYEVAAVVDIDLGRAELLAKEYGAKASTDWQEIVKDKAIDIVVILTFPDTHAPIAIEAMRNGKDVLCEKPISRTLEEAKEIVEVAKTTGRIFKTGFNHRHHPAFLKAREIVERGELGKPLFGRARYGIAGRPGTEKEWRSDTKVIGGGQLMDQGIHLIDLFRAFLGDFKEVVGMISTNYWPIEPMEDNGFALMKSKDNVIVSLHSSTTQWINLFDFEIGYENGAINVTGLGASYGTQTLRVTKRDDSGPFTYETFEFRGADVSWKNEWQTFSTAVESRVEPVGNGEDGLRSLELVYDIYRAAETGQIIKK